LGVIANPGVKVRQRGKSSCGIRGVQAAGIFNDAQRLLEQQLGLGIFIQVQVTGTLIP